MLRVAFQTSEQDAAHAARSLARGRNTGVRVGVILFLVALPTSLIFTLRGSSSALAGSLALGAALIAFAVMVWGLPALAAAKAVRQYHKFPEFHGEFVYEFGTTGFTFSTPASRLELPWSMVVRVQQDARLLYLATRAEFTYYIPVSAVSAADVQAIRELFSVGQGRSTV